MGRWSGALLAACALGLAGCSSSSSAGGSEALEGGLDAAVHDATTSDATPFEASVGDAPTLDAGEADADAEAGPACLIPVAVSSSDACNDCVEAYCDPAWCTCAEDTAYEEAGVNGCERYVACVSQCVQADAGLPTTCTQTLCAHAPYTYEEQQEGRALLNCVVLHCSMECPQ